MIFIIVFLLIIIIILLVKYLYLLKIYKEIKILQKHLIDKSIFEITYEAKNPLSVCLGYLSMNKENKKEFNIIKDEIDKSIKILDDNLESHTYYLGYEEFDLVYLINDLKKYQKININRSEYNVYSNYNSINDLLMYLIILNNKIQIRVEDDLIYIEYNKNNVDKNLIKQLLSNINGIYDIRDSYIILDLKKAI